jgi:hypothetical protein
VGVAALAAERRSLVRRARARQGSVTVRGDRAVDVAAIERALRELEVRWPVVVIFSAEHGRDGRTGQLLLTRGRHEILLFNARNRTGRSLSQTLWHEVTHSVQREEWGDAEFIRQYKTGTGRDDLEDEAATLARRLLHRYGTVIS